MTEKLAAPSGDIKYQNISFDELEIKWKGKQSTETQAPFGALSGWLSDNSEDIPLGKSKVVWKNHSVVGDVAMKIEGDKITLPAGFAYRLRSDLGIYKPVSEEKNVFYSVGSQWVDTTGAGDVKLGSLGQNTCEGTGAQEVRNRSSLPATAYVQAATDTTVSLEVEYADQALKLAKGSQIHIEVVGVVKAKDKEEAKPKPAQTLRFNPFNK